ncbi:unnamed protein product [Cuscuta campestris]|uniref:Thioredoxin domain-containing protein n=1 Tax=Cuscuta campestris TaxID=132261 RepID=A0A484N4M6_9ASTE|nr:unnamed protein product [Cuscuta campestris]
MGSGFSNPTSSSSSPGAAFGALRRTGSYTYGSSSAPAPSPNKPLLNTTTATVNITTPPPLLPSATPNKPLVTAFHSSVQWKIHSEASKKTNKLMVIDFTATWCGPCKTMEQPINELAAQFKDVDFVKIDVDELIDVAKEFNVTCMPTLVLMKSGKVVDKVVGAKKDELRDKILKHRN